MKITLKVLGVWVGILAVLLAMAWSVQLLNALSPPAQAGEGPNVTRQIENLARSLQQVQDETRKNRVEIELLKQCPTVKREYKALMLKIAKEDQERRK